MNNDYNKTRNIVNNSVDLTTVPVDSNNKAYIIDERLLGVLLSKVTKGNLNDIKKDIINVVDNADSKQDLFNKLDEYLYLDKIVQVITQAEIDADTAKHTGKIDLGKDRLGGMIDDDMKAVCS